LFKGIPQVKYFKYPVKMPLGEKRNLMHLKCKGDIIVYMDDDDYYPPQRVSHAVKTLKMNPKALCVGASKLYIYFKDRSQMYESGPYGPNHATAATFAFRRKMLDDHAYEDGACLAEERKFLKDYTVPFAQLDPLKTILVFSHDHNSFDKRKLFDQPGSEKVLRPSTLKVSNFITDSKLQDFYLNLEAVLKDYDFGHPKHKPDVIKQSAEIQERRKKMAQNSKCLMKMVNGKPVALNPQEVTQIVNELQKKILKLSITATMQSEELTALQSRSPTPLPLLYTNKVLSVPNPTIPCM